MSGFAALIDPNSLSQQRERIFEGFVRPVAEYKRLSFPPEYAAGRHCIGAKLDSPSSLHRGVTRDPETGSWLFAAGTLVDIDPKNSDPCLYALLRDYLEIGAEALRHYDGHFALVIYNGRDESLSVISDPIGLFSIFYGTRGGETFISTSALAIARQIRTEPDLLAVECFLRTGRVHGNRTLWRDVKRASAATVLTFTQHTVRESKYWAPAVDPNIAKLSFDEALEEATEMLSRTFKRALHREGRVWADLTGGFDSRLVTMLLAKVGIPFTTNCVGPADHPDVKISRLISQEMNWEYRHILLPSNWEHEQYGWLETALHKGDAHLNVFQLAGVLWGHQEKSFTSKIHVLGLGGENWRGYFWSGELFNIGQASITNYDHVLARLLLPVPVSVFREDRTKEVQLELRKHFDEVVSLYAEFPNTVKLDSWYIFHRHPTHSGAYLSAAAGVLRSLIPLCFKEPTTFAFSLNYKWKLPNSYRFARVLLEKENPRLANLMTTGGGPAIPMRVTNLHRFSPLWKAMTNRATRKVSQKVFKRPITIWPDKSNYDTYPLPAWKKGWLNSATAGGLLNPSQMHSGRLYDTNGLQTLVSQAWAQDFKHGEFLERILTVEMAMRTVGACVP